MAVEFLEDLGKIYPQNALIPKEELPDWSKKPDQTPSYDRGGHRERSQANDQGQHERHWRREDARALNH